MTRFQGKNVFVSGAASGIGQAAAKRLAAEGATCFCTDINQAMLQATVDDIKANGGSAVAHVMDISDESSVNEAVAACQSQLGGMDVLVNMAGVLKMTHFDQMEFSDWQRLVNINLSGTFLLCKASLPLLVESKGNIVNAASTSALQGLPWGGAYGATKGGVLAMTRGIAVEFAKRGVRANAVCPGDIKTTMTDTVSLPNDADFSLMGRISSLTGPTGPEAVASVIAMLASEDGKHITGESIRVDGGTLA